MKKILITFVILPLLAVSGFLGHRFTQNTSQITPYPFVFSEKLLPAEQKFAPIAIVGDSMAVRLASFIPKMQSILSENLSKPIAINDYSSPGETIHRTLQKLKEINKMPLIIIYLGNLDQSAEKLYDTKYTSLIKQNFLLFDNDYAKTAMMLFPWVSRFIYHPIKKVKLGKQIIPLDEDKNDFVRQTRLGVYYRLYETTFNELITYTQAKNSLLIPVTTPINYLNKPIKNCYGSIENDSVAEYKRLIELSKAGKTKEALTLAKELSLIYPSHSGILYYYGLLLAKSQEGQQSIGFLRKSVAFDCGNKYANPIYNEILKKYADKYGVTYFDFEELTNEQLLTDHPFLDEVYPQDIYLEKVINTLALRIKTLLKL